MTRESLKAEIETLAMLLRKQADSQTDKWVARYKIHFLIEQFNKKYPNYDQ